MTLYYVNSRDIREYKSRVESYSREMLRKEAQVRELQSRLENGEGSKLFIHYFPEKIRKISISWLLIITSKVTRELLRIFVCPRISIFQCSASLSLFLRNSCTLCQKKLHNIS